MELSHDDCYRALISHDARFDGVFFVGVASTGIYCRPVCTAKTPRQTGCAFYPSAAAAEKAGFRPCLRCRPERAPGNARTDSASRLAVLALNHIEDGTHGISHLAQRLHVSERHLRRVVAQEYGVSPVALAQTHRLLLAKRLLSETNLPLTQVALASGFHSLRRFNALFQERYRLSPSRVRGQQKETPLDTLRFELAYRPPLDWDEMLQFLAGRSVRGVEVGDGGIYRRTVRLQNATGWLSVEPYPGARPVLIVHISASLAPVVAPVLTRIKRLFDLAAAPDAINAHLSMDARLAPLVARRPGLRVPGAFDGWEMSVRAILGQQISVGAATTLAGRFAAAFGDPIKTPYEGLTHLFPAPERTASAAETEIIALGIIAVRARAILGLARAVAEGSLSLEPTGDVDETLRRLEALPGIGPWTAQYIALRALSWPDAFPHTDLGICKALNESNPRRVLAIAEAWRPWRAYAVRHLWRSLSDEKETK